MRNHGHYNKDHGVEHQGLARAADVYWSLPVAALYEHALRRGEAAVTEHGALVAHTGKHTGRSARDKYIVREHGSEQQIWWDNNPPMSPATFDALHREVCAYLDGREVFVQDCFAGADPATRLSLRVITECAWHSLFTRHMMIRAGDEERAAHEPRFSVIAAPGFEADPERHNTRSGVFIAIHFAKRMVLIGGTSYAGEIKKAVFTVMNYLLPAAGVMPMHSSANMGGDGATAVFFGLSGTGKTTLSANASRVLIGDDEHGWNDDGVFNIEGGCYAKTIRLSPLDEPEIFATTRMFGTVLENVAYDPVTRRIALDDGGLTENTRGSYPVEFITNASVTGLGAHPSHILLLTCDAFGVLPPVSRLNIEQAIYHFINGYTARVAGTEKSVLEPAPVFSPCYGGPFLPLHPGRYAAMLGAKIRRHDVAVWLINTGWSGGACGVGERIPLRYTRAIVNAVLDGGLSDAATRRHEIFGLDRLCSCPGVPESVLDPAASWLSGDAYRDQAVKLAALFEQNFGKYAGAVSVSMETGDAPRHAVTA